MEQQAYQRREKHARGRACNRSAKGCEDVRREPPKGTPRYRIVASTRSEPSGNLVVDGVSPRSRALSLSHSAWESPLQYTIIHTTLPCACSNCWNKGQLSMYLQL